MASDAISATDHVRPSISKANTLPPAGTSLREALATGTSSSTTNNKFPPSPSPSESGTTTPTTRARRAILSSARDDAEIRAMLIARLDQLEGGGAANGKHGTKRLRDLVFTQRFTTFDRQNPLSADSPFHGFFVLFWLGIGGVLLKIAAQNWRDYGHPLGRAEILHMMTDRDLIVMGLTDGVMVGSTIVGLAMQKLVAKEVISWRRTGWWLQNLWQTAFLGMVLWWVWWREWPWTHTIFMVMHTLVFVMKQHSYAFYNGYLSQLSRRRRLLVHKLEDLKDIEPSDNRAPSSANHTASADVLRLRRPSLSSRTLTNPAMEKDSSIGDIINAIDRGDSVTTRDLTVFSSALASELTAIDSELNGKTSDPSKQYPNNLTVANWADWTCLPTLVYELEYPRQKTRNWWYIAEKSAATLGVIWVMIVISQQYIYPAVAETVAMKAAGMSLAERWHTFPWIVSDLMIPLLLEQLLTWWVLFESILNVMAELTLFADRDFYGTWWNSVSWDQYARDWNRPVHSFLLRHVYNSSISSFHLSKTLATFMTFLLSALVHELLMFVLFKKVRGYLFAMQLAQIPLAASSRTRFMKDRKVLGNVIVLFGLFVGPALITSLYLIV